MDWLCVRVHLKKSHESCGLLGVGDGTGMGCWALKALQGSAGRKEVWKGFHSCSTGKDECTKAVGYLGERGDHEARSSVQFSRSVVSDSL